MRGLKILAILIVLLTTTSAFANGYFTVKQPAFRSALGSAFNYYPYVDNYTPDVSLYISEPFSKKWTFTSYSGYIQGTTLVLDEGVSYSFGERFRAGFGGVYTHGTITDTFNNRQDYRNLEGKVWGEYKLW